MRLSQGGLWLGPLGVFTAYIRGSTGIHIFAVHIQGTGVFSGGMVLLQKRLFMLIHIDTIHFYFSLSSARLNDATSMGWNASD